jgi:hypothetical protein
VIEYPGWTLLPRSRNNPRKGIRESIARCRREQAIRTRFTRRHIAPQLRARAFRRLAVGVVIALGGGLALTAGFADMAPRRAPPASSTTAITAAPVGEILVRGGFAKPALRFESELSEPGLGQQAVEIVHDATPTSRDGVDLAIRIVAAEGGPARNPASSAAGYGQFLRSTWLDVFARAYPNLARMLNTEQILALRDVKPLALDLTDRYARENAAVLIREGVPATDVALSLAHALGAGGAASVLSAPLGRPAVQMLSAEAIVANPQLAMLTADGLQRWATQRIAATNARPSSSPSAPVHPADSVPLFPPMEDFRVDGSSMASEVLLANQTQIARLQGAVETLAGRRNDGKTASVKMAMAEGEAVLGARKAVLDAIHTVVDRPGYKQFRRLGKHAEQGGRLPADVARDLALILAGKMRQENATILDRVAHGRSNNRTAIQTSASPLSGTSAMKRGGAAESLSAF